MTAVVYEFQLRKLYCYVYKKTHIYELKQIVIVWKNLNWKQQQEQCTVRWKFILLFITSQ